MSCAPSWAVENWGSSGLAFLTGLPAGPPDFSRAQVLARAQRVADAAGAALGITVDAATVLAGRAALLGLTRAGRVSAGGATRLLAARDGWWALTLSRPDDLAAVAALLQADRVPADPWRALKRWAATRFTDAIGERAALLDLPAAVLGEAGAGGAAACRVGRDAPRAAPRTAEGLLVADLSSMWAGPVCGQMLARAGATVVKVESRRRPDGTRGGNGAFFDWMNGEKLSYCLDFDNDADELRELLSVADIVIEGSRPAALARRRLSAEHLAGRPGRIWLQVNGYDGARPAFGDDAAVGGGLVGIAGPPGDAAPVFCGDAIADPLTGLEAARAVADSLARGGGESIRLSMAGVAATYARLPIERPAPGLPAPPPQPPPPSVPAPALGADNAEVRHLVAQRRCLSC